jgi:hypothetical protein
MKYLFLPAFFGLALAGCTSSDQNSIVVGTPVTETFAPTSSSQGASTGDYTVMSTSDGTAALSRTVPAMPPTESTAVGFPPPPSCGPGSAETRCEAPARLDKCRTAGSVTTCDVPPDPMADSTNYTN